jgi:hypothetical protein
MVKRIMQLQGLDTAGYGLLICIRVRLLAGLHRLGAAKYLPNETTDGR